MQNNNELKDILLDKEDELKSHKLKKLLISIAALSILFLIVIATIKILNSDDSAQNNEIDSRLVLPPMPDEKQNLAPQIVKDDRKNSEQLFEQVPIFPENKTQDDFEDMVKKLKEKDSSNSVQNKLEPVETIKPKPVINPIPVETKKEVVVAQIQKDKLEPKRTEIKKQEPTKKQQEKSASNVDNKDAKKQTTDVKSSSLSAGSYIQVFATKSTPDQKELRKVSSKGYVYNILKVGDVNKVLVGPFSGSKLQSELSNIRKEINKGAFIYKVK